MGRGAAVHYSAPQYSGNLNTDESVLSKINLILSQSGSTGTAKMQIKKALQDYIDKYETGFFSFLKASGVARAKKMLSEIEAATSIPNMLYVIQGEIDKGVDLIATLKLCIVNGFFQPDEISKKKNEKSWDDSYTCNALFNVILKNATPDVQLTVIAS